VIAFQGIGYGFLINNRTSAHVDQVASALYARQRLAAEQVKRIRR
jgi:hypothetical protein